MPIRPDETSGGPSHFGAAAAPAGRSGLATGVVSLGSGSVRLMPDTFHARSLRVRQQTTQELTGSATGQSRRRSRPARDQRHRDRLGLVTPPHLRRPRPDAGRGLLTESITNGRVESRSLSGDERPHRSPPSPELPTRPNRRPSLRPAPFRRHPGRPARVNPTNPLRARLSASQGALAVMPDSSAACDAFAAAGLTRGPESHAVGTRHTMPTAPRRGRPTWGAHRTAGPYGSLGSRTRRTGRGLCRDGIGHLVPARARQPPPSRDTAPTPAPDL